MKRTIYKYLIKWKNEPSRKPLLLRGARQTGKTYIVEEFGSNEFDNVITLNFERNPEYKAIFDTYDTNDILEKITLFTGRSFSIGKTLIFLDEIQDCPKAIIALRYFYEEKPDIHIIGAGSLLEFSLNSEDFRMPVGRIQYMFMYPMSFIEFLNAIGEIALADYIQKFENLNKLTPELHEKLLSLVQKYFITGGMPEVVQEYISSNDFIKCRRIQRSILDTYIDDFAKYSSIIKHKYLKTVFNSIPSILGNKVVYSKIESSYKSRDLKEAIELLETAGIITRCIRSGGSGIPLKASVRENFYKLIFLDIGLFNSLSGMIEKTANEKNLDVIFKGAATEQFVGQEIICSQSPFTKPGLFYWAREAKNSNAKLDFLIEKGGEVIPIEVKSGKKGVYKSLNMFIEKFNSKNALKISQNQYSVENNIISLPLYGINSYIRNAEVRHMRGVE